MIKSMLILTSAFASLILLLSIFLFRHAVSNKKGVLSHARSQTAQQRK